MKTKLLLSAILGCSWLAFTATASAQGTGNTRQTYDAKFNEVATPDAPAGSKGSARIKSQTKNGETTSTLFLATEGLDPGDYTVSGVQASDGATVLLIEQFTVGDTGGGKTRTKDKLSLSPDQDVTDLIELIVANGDGVNVLTGDLSGNNSFATLNSKVPVIPGDAAPSATGSAVLKSEVKKGKRKDQFNMTAVGVTPNTVFNVFVDGTDTGQTVKSNKKSKVVVKKLPKGTTEVNSVSLVDESGTEAVRADF